MGSKVKSDNKKAKKQAKKEAAEKARKAAEEAARKAAELAKLAEAEESSDSDSSSDSSNSDSSDEEAPVSKKASKKKEKADTKTEKETKGKDQIKSTNEDSSSSDSSSADSSDDDSSDDDEEEKSSPKDNGSSKVSKVDSKVEVSSSNSDDSSDDDESDESSDAPEKSKDKSSADKKNKPVSKEESSSDSDDSSDDDSTKSSAAPEDSDMKDTKDEITHSNKRKSSDAGDPPVKKVALDDGHNTKLYIRGLPWRATEDEVREFFTACGPIASCELPLQDDGRSSGTAVVEFETDEAAAKGIELNGEDFQGRWLSIKYSTPKPISGARERTEKPPGCLTVFVGNLSWEIDEESLRAAFADCGEITQVRFATDRETQEFKGFGHIEFSETEATDKAIEMAGTDIMGRQVRVDYAADRRSSFGGAGGGRGRGRGRGGRSPGGFGGGGRGRGRGDGGGRGRGGNSFGAKKHGSISEFQGNKITFD